MAGEMSGALENCRYEVLCGWNGEERLELDRTGEGLQRLGQGK